MKLPATIKTILGCPPSSTSISASGWVRSLRKQKHVSFLEINDGSSTQNLQIILPSKNIEGWDLIAGTCIKVLGKLVQSPAKGQSLELQADDIEIIGACSSDYPIQKKDHSLEFLRTVPHLRGRTAFHSAIQRIRHSAAHTLRNYLHDNEFAEIHAPVITFSDCEGAGEAFSVEGSKEFFGGQARLTVSAQLHAEIAAISMPRVYTFGPTFRAEKHNTQRHMSEFWMLEPEISFINSLDQLMDSIEGLLAESSKRLLDSSSQDLESLSATLDNRDEMEKRWKMTQEPFDRITYSDALKILEKHSHEFTRKLKWGDALQLEHEKFIAEKIFGNPIFVTDYPKSLKPFYMRSNEDGKTVACCDLLVPGLAEIVGGSLREERRDMLESSMRDLKMDMDAYSWYLDLRRFGGAPHGGFGLGFDRYLQFMTGIPNIRDVCLIPRTQHNHRY